MRKIIDGKVYNTDTAELIANASHAYRGDFRWWDEDLYRTKKGRWFLHGEGGPMSSWAVAVSTGGWSGGEGLRALSEDEALEWCENNRIDPSVMEQHLKIEEA